MLDILENVCNTSDHDFATATLVRYLNQSGRVSGQEVREQAQCLLDCIANKKDPGDTAEYLTLLEYVESHVDIALHNYANAVSHREDPPSEDMENIRTWQTLRSLIVELDFQDEEWDVAEGWKVQPDAQNIIM